MKKVFLSFLLLLLSFFGVYGQYTITNIADSGPGSLRQAIIDANNDNAGSYITSMTYGTIYLMSPLPEITEDLYIDGLGITLDGQWSITGPPIIINECLAPNSNYEYFNGFQNFIYPSVLYVTNTNECGSGSLRRAINNSNQGYGANIYFSIPGTPPHLISLSTALPAIEYGVTIDGSTQPNNGYTGTAPKIEIRGNGSIGGLRFSGANGFEVYGLHITNFTSGIYFGYYDNVCSNFIIGSNTKGNVISGNTFAGIFIDHYSGISSGGVIRGNYFGTTVNGDSANGNDCAFDLGSECIYMVIEDNVVSGNGVAFRGGFDNIDYLTFRGNKVGVDKTGTYAIPNDGIGFFYSNHSVFGGSSAGDRNIISGNNSGFIISGDYNIFQGNYIGTDVTGSYAIPNNADNLHGAIHMAGNNILIGGQLLTEGNVVSGNTGSGITLYSTSGSSIEGNIVGLDATGTYAIGNDRGVSLDFDSENISIGSLFTSHRNIISGNSSHGLITLYRCKNISIMNNYIGTNISGTSSIPNGTGINLQSAKEITIGGINKGNLISGNSTNGIIIYNADSTGSIDIIANKIGTDVSGTGDLGNSTGINIYSSDSLVCIGGDDINKKNTIAYNNYGVILNASTKCMIRKNNIFNNDSKGINLRYNTAYEGNNGYPPPLIEFFDYSSVAGTSEPNAIIDIYYNHTGNVTPQGKTYIGSTYSDTIGNWSYTCSFSAPCITATATDPVFLTTSEFSQTAPIISEIIPDSIGICSGDSTIITASYDYMYSFLWPDSSTSHTLIINSPGLYWVKISDNCGNFKYDTVIVYEKNIYNIYTTGDTTICPGDSVNINGYNAFSYDWNFGLSNNSSLIVAPSNNQDYILNATDSAGCSFSDTVHVLVNPHYNIYEVYNVCVGDSVYFEGNYYSQDTTVIANYSTFLGCDSILQMDLNIKPTYFQTSTHTICDNDSLFWEGNYYDTTGMYYLYLLSVYGCDSILELDLTVFPNPSNLNLIGLDTVILGQTEIYYILPDSLYYLWSVEKGTILQQIANNVIQVQWDSIGLGHIYVIAEDQNGCMSDTTILDVVIGTNGLEDISNNNGLLIYPNPTNNEIIIETKGFIEVELYNNLGQIVIKSNKNKINLQKFSKGIYFAKVLTTEGIKSTIVIKE
jgi:parallel beta-helix repeat protein